VSIHLEVHPHMLTNTSFTRGNVKPFVGEKYFQPSLTFAGSDRLTLVGDKHSSLKRRRKKMCFYKIDAWSEYSGTMALMMMLKMFEKVRPDLNAIKL
jgi:hypothetical protein